MSASCVDDLRQGCAAVWLDFRQSHPPMQSAMEEVLVCVVVE